MVVSQKTAQPFFLIPTTKTKRGKYEIHTNKVIQGTFLQV